jgi:cytochrome c biogenesis protein CcdA
MTNRKVFKFDESMSWGLALMLNGLFVLWGFLVSYDRDEISIAMILAGCAMVFLGWCLYGGVAKSSSNMTDRQEALRHDR